jgi:hypothetical protein
MALSSLKRNGETLRVGRHEVHFMTQGLVVSLEIRTSYQCKI